MAFSEEMKALIDIDQEARRQERERCLAAIQAETYLSVVARDRILSRIQDPGWRPEEQ